MRRSLAVVAGLALAMSFLGTVPKGVAATSEWRPNPTGLLDCNGLSPVQRVVKHLQCLDIAANHQDWHFYLHFFQLHFQLVKHPSSNRLARTAWSISAA